MRNFWQKLNKPILALAPMAGFTDSAFRQICRKYGADVVYSEMASASGLFYSLCGIRRYAASGKATILQGKSPKTLELLKFSKYERPYVVQLFGGNPEHFARATKIITEKIKPDGIDINMGCPVRKVMKTGAGCALMTNPELAREIIKAVCRNTNLPVSIKVRAGIGKHRDMHFRGHCGTYHGTYQNSALNFIKKIKDLPFSAVMLHCRTYEQGFSGTPDYSVAEKIKKIIPDKIVLINGGINSKEDATGILKKYSNIDGLGIARGALGCPWIFEEIKSYLPSSLLEKGTGGGKKYNIKKIFLSHLELTAKNKGLQGFKEFRSHIGWYFRGFAGASELRRKLIQAKNLKEMEKTLK